MKLGHGRNKVGLSMCACSLHILGVELLFIMHMLKVYLDAAGSWKELGGAEHVCVCMCVCVCALHNLDMMPISLCNPLDNYVE